MFKQLQDMALFALVAEMGSFTAAAQKAELPKSSVSQRISQLEQQVGIRLLNRTTRRLNLTFAGEHYLVHCREMLAASERAEYAIQRLRENPSGRLRITCPHGDWRDAAGAYECRVPASLSRGFAGRVDL